MKERPIIMSAESVRAILDGRKTQTRRVVKPQPKGFWGEPNKCLAGGVLQAIVHDESAKNVGKISDKYIRCPYGAPGDRLWVKEAFYQHKYIGMKFLDEPIATNEMPSYRKVSPLHMPRWAARLTLEVVAVRVERLQEITYSEVRAEGFCCPEHDFPGGMCVSPCLTLLNEFACSWDALNAKRGYPWASNPWVWVVEFKRMTAAEAVTA